MGKRVTFAQNIVNKFGQLKKKSQPSTFRYNEKQEDLNSAQEKNEDLIENNKEESSSSTSEIWKMSSQIIPSIVINDSLQNTTIQASKTHTNGRSRKTRNSKLKVDHRSDIDIEEIRKFMNRNNDLNI